MVISEWLDNDEALVAPSPSIKTSSRDMRVEAQSKGQEGFPKQRAEQVPIVGATRPLAQDTRVDPREKPGCSGRQRQFKTVYWEADV